MNTTIILLDATKPAVIDNFAGYIIGAIIALLLLVYLFYSLIKPEKF